MPHQRTYYNALLHLTSELTFIWRSQHRWWHLSGKKVSFVFTADTHTNNSRGKKPTESLLDISVDGELASSQTTDHEKTSGKTSKGAADTKLAANLDKPRNDALTGHTLGLVNLGQHGVGRLGNNRSGETGDETRAQVHGSLATAGQARLVELGKDKFGNLLKSDELGHSVRDPGLIFFTVRTGSPLFDKNQGGYDVLFEQDGHESRVERANTLILENLGESADETVGEARGRNETDAGGLQGAQRNRREKLGRGGRHRVDKTTVLARSLEAEEVDGLLLEKLVTAKLERALDKVSGKRRAESRQQSSGALILDDLAETTDHALVVGGRVQLDPGLDAVCN